MSAPSEIDKAIALLCALKWARPAAFDEAMARLATAPSPGAQESPAHSASALALGLLKGSFSPEAAQMLLELSPQLPRAGLALGFFPRLGAPASSLACKAIRAGLDTPWARFFAHAIGDGSMPMDPECALDVACRLAEAFDDSDEQPCWAGRAELFHDALGAILDWPLDWRDIQSQAGFEFVPWILERWLPEGGLDASFGALRACIRLFQAGACAALPMGAWLEFASPARPELLETSLRAMRECLPFCRQAMLDGGETPSLLFCKRAAPGPHMAQALRACLALDPQGPTRIAPDGSSCMSLINQRLGLPGSELWRAPLLECFHVLLEHGSDPRWIAPRVSPAAIANDPQVAAAVEAAEIAEQAHAAPHGARGSL